MKIVVNGGTGRIGSRVVKKLRALGHDAVAASPRSGVNAVTGEGLAEALAGAQVVIDVSNSPSFIGTPLDFFERSGRNLAAAEIAAGVKHHVALSVVGTERLLDSPYFRGKIAQEQIIAGGRVPYTIVRATQFFEFLDAIAQGGTDGQTVRLSPALFQPIAAEDVADAMVDAALGTPANGIIEVAGPERVSLAAFVQRYLSAKRDPRKVIADEQALYFGVKLNDQSLTPGEKPRIGATRFEDWLKPG